MTSLYIASYMKLTGKENGGTCQLIIGQEKEESKNREGVEDKEPREGWEDDDGLDSLVNGNEPSLMNQITQL